MVIGTFKSIFIGDEDHLFLVMNINKTRRKPQLLPRSPSPNYLSLRIFYPRRPFVFPNPIMGDFFHVPIPLGSRSSHKVSKFKRKKILILNSNIKLFCYSLVSQSYPSNENVTHVLKNPPHL